MRISITLGVLTFLFVFGMLVTHARSETTNEEVYKSRAEEGLCVRNPDFDGCPKKRKGRK